MATVPPYAEPSYLDDETSQAFGKPSSMAAGPAQPRQLAASNTTALRSTHSSKDRNKPKAELARIFYRNMQERRTKAFLPAKVGTLKNPARRTDNETQQRADCKEGAT